MGNLVPSLPQFAKASFGMPGTLFRKLMQSLESNLGKTTQLRDENAFI